ncbi:MAG: tetratricopeptide repeat protein [Aliishimia sp.]
MSLKDQYDNIVGTNSTAALAEYISGIDLFLSGSYGAVQAFERAVTHDGGFALGHVGLARARQMSMDMAGAKAALAQAVTLRDGLSAREQSHIACFEALFDGRAGPCRAMVEEHVQTWPRDAMAAQLCAGVFSLIGFSGEIGREDALLAYTTQLSPHYGEDWWMMSMHAMAMCETGQAAASEALMDKALALNNANAHGAHFKAHAMYESGQTEAGRAYLSEWVAWYDPRAVLHSHLRWHEALWALHAGDMATMWERVDSGVGPDASLGMPLNILTDTAAILYRAELAGEAVPTSRWADLSAYATKCFPEPGQSFADMHAALAHAMAGDGDRLAKIAETSRGFAADLVRPVAKAWGAIARQDWSGAVAELGPILPVNQRFGGSRAQRDLLEFAYVNAQMRLGQGEEARRLLAKRRPIFGDRVPVAG